MSTSYYLLLVDSTFDGCHATTGSGGAVFLSAMPGDVAIVGTTFQGCSASEVGGAMTLLVGPSEGYSSTASQGPPGQTSSIVFTLNTPLDVVDDLGKTYTELRLPGSQTHARNTFSGNSAGLGGGALF